jgi:hypothetical protein
MPSAAISAIEATQTLLIRLLCDRLGWGISPGSPVHECNIRGFLRTYVRELVPERRRQGDRRFLSSAASDITLTTLEHPGKWDEARQIALWTS